MTVRILTGDCMDLLRTLPDESVHCVVTSPPYFGLRDYGVPPTAWPAVEFTPVAGLPPYTVPAMTCCMGLEPDPWAFVAHCVAVFREVWRVLRADGTLWLNLGDSYAGKGGQAVQSGRLFKGKARQRESVCISARSRAPGLKPKDLLGIPARVAFALQADGWWWRQGIVWNKLNPMPESVTDRCTKAHEDLFLLSKSERYYFDAEAIKERSSEGTHQRRSKYPDGKKPVAGWATGPGDHSAISHAQPKGGARKLADDGYNKNNSSFDAAMSVMPEWRNKRSVWSIATQPFKEAHYATFPAALVEPCILAGCPEGGTVLDPFGGSGTTGMVANRLHRNAILIELKPENVAMSERRITREAPLLARVAT